MKNMLNFMNATRSACAAYGYNGKADSHRNRRGREWSRARTLELEKLNKRQPVTTYKLEGF